MRLFQNRFFWLAAFFASLILLQVKYNFFKDLPTIIEQTSTSGIKGYLGFILIYIVSTIMMLPGSPLTFTAGALFGF